MARRRILYKKNNPTQNLDSFLDIMTNTVGVLMFVSLFITLVAVQSGTIIRTPLVSRTEKNPHLFEIRGDEITYIDTNNVQQQVENYIDGLPECTEPSEPSYYDTYAFSIYIERMREYNNCMVGKVEQLKQFRPSTEFYRVRLVDLESFAWEYERNDNRGITPEELAREDSQFKQIIDRLDNKEDYIAFIVRPDSFQTFRKAREIAWKKGFNVGWEPHESDSSIVFGSKGRSIGVQ